MKTFSVSGGLAGPPSACLSTPDGIDVFAVGSGGAVWRWGDTTNWSPSQLFLGGRSIPAEGLCAISSGPDRAELFAVEGPSRTPVWWRWNGALWTPGRDLSAGQARISPVPVAAVAASPNEIDIFAVGDDTNIWWWHWNGTDWSSSAMLPGGANLPTERVAAVSPAPGRLDVFAVGRNTHLWHWRKVGAAAWSIQDLGGNLPQEGVGAVSWGQGRIDIFAVSREAGNPLQHWWSSGTGFSGPENIGENFAPGTVGAISHSPDRLDVFAISRGQRLVQWQWNGQRWVGPNVRGENIPEGDVSAVVRKPHRIDVFVTGSGSTLQRWPGGGLENATPRTWTNWPTNRSSTGAVGHLRPGSLEELVNIVREAAQLGRRVRAVGSSWSNSDVAVSPDSVLETDLLASELTDVLDTCLNATGSGLRLVHVEAGIKLHALNDLLDRRQLALKTLGGSTGQSLAGALSTSTRGMDIDRGPLAEMVRAIHLVGPGGVQHWIEPATRTITSKDRLKDALRLADENIHYDDDWFYSVLVSVGSMGVIYSLVVEVDPQYDLIDRREPLDWNAAKARLLAMSKALSADRVVDRVVGGGAGNTLVRPGGIPGRDASLDPFAGNRGVQVVLNPYPTDYRAGGRSRTCYLTNRTQGSATEKSAQPNPAALLEFVTPGLVAAIRTDRRLADTAINALTALQQSAGTLRGWSHTISGGLPPEQLKGLTVAVVFDARTTWYLDFVDAALEIIRAAYYDEPASLAYLGWISLRFQGPSRAYLSPQHGRARTCMIEFAAFWRMPGVPGVGWAETPILLARIEAAARRFGGIQHWGLNDTLDASDVVRAYPRLDTWRRVRWELTKGGTITTFDSDFTRRCGLSRPPVFAGSGDYDGDGKADVAVWRPGSGTWLIKSSATGAERTQQWGQVGDIPVPGDYGGDGRTDFAVWRPDSGTWFIKNSVTGVERTQQWGQAGDIPVPGDYDGNGRTDFAVWRPDSGTWFIKNSVTGAERSQQWGQAGDIPVPGDYDGNRRTDFAVWRPGSGTWLIKNSATGAETNQQWGQAGDIPVPGDYDGDGRTDFAVLRPSTGTWFIIDSSTGTRRDLQVAQAGDIPVPGDYDGDGKSDLALWRPSNGGWVIRASSTGLGRAVDWGQFGDIPV